MTHDPAHDSSDLYPADIAPVARALDQLGEAERRAARADLEPRIARAAMIARAEPALRLTSSAAPALHPARWATAPRMRLAAGVAIVAGALAAWFALRPAPAPAPHLDTGSLEQDVDAWLALAGPDDELRAEIEVMLLQSDDLARGLGVEWVEDELIGESL